MLDWIFHRSELLTTFDAGLYRETLARLSAANIPFRTKWSSPADPGRPNAFGESLKRSTQYYIYVLDRDLEEAAFAIR